MCRHLVRADLHGLRVLNIYLLKHVKVHQAKTYKLCYNETENAKEFLWHPMASVNL